MKKYHPGEPVDINMQSLINIIRENNRVITTLKGKDKLILLFGKRERVITIYGMREEEYISLPEQKAVDKHRYRINSTFL